MANTWFRLHAKLLRNRKVQSLKAEDFKALINLWCLACEREGSIPCVEDIAFHLRITVKSAERAVETLSQFIEPNGDGTFEAHDWNEHQFLSDVSTPRVKRFRERKRNVSETVPDTDTDTDSETEHKVLTAQAPSSRDPPPEIRLVSKVDPVELWFDSEFWPRWIKRDQDVKEAALTQARSKAKTIAIRAEIMVGLEAQREQRAAESSEFRVSARRWLKEGQWKSNPEAPLPGLLMELRNHKPNFVESVEGVMRSRVERGLSPL